MSFYELITGLIYLKVFFLFKKMQLYAFLKKLANRLFIFVLMQKMSAHRSHLFDLIYELKLKTVKNRDWEKKDKIRSDFHKKDRNHSPNSDLKIWTTYSLRLGALMEVISDIHRVLWASADPVDASTEPVLKPFLL